MGGKYAITAQTFGGNTVSVNVEIVGTTPQEVVAAVRRLGRLPESVVSTPARYAAGREAALAKKLAPKKSGLLRESLKVSRKERTAIRGKAVYDVRPMSESEWNAREDKRVQKGRTRRGYTFASVSANGKRYYYPASMEYGFEARDGRTIPGRRFMKNAAQALNQQVEQMILDRAGRKLDQIWEKAGT